MYRDHKMKYFEYLKLSNQSLAVKYCDNDGKIQSLLLAKIWAITYPRIDFRKDIINAAYMLT